MFDPYSAERHSQRTRQQGRSATRAVPISVSPEGLRRSAWSVVRRRPGCSQRGTRAPLRLACLGRGHGPADHFPFMVML
jgi:hypothetical protein